MTEFSTSRRYAQGLDNNDKFANFSKEFNYPYNINGQKSTYLTGHSLGLQPKKSVDAVMESLDSWHRLAVKGHHEGSWPWLPYHEFITDSLAKIVGAKPSEVVSMNSLTVNLHLLMVSFYRPTKNKYKILIEDHAFPSDDYAVQSQVKYHGFDPSQAIVRLKPRAGQYCLDTADINNYINDNSDEIALILLPGVQYYTGQVLDIESITKVAHDNNIIIGFDLAHAAGNIDLKLHEWKVDFACWCHYKYLNSGPGAVGGCFVHENHVNDSTLPKFCGWWGHDKASRFKMPLQFKPIPTVESWQLSNPPILSLASIRGSLSLFNEAGGIGQLQVKASELSSYLINLVTLELKEKIQILTPEDQKGCQVSLKFIGENAELINQKLLAANIITDYRNPDVIRVAAVPLYNSFQDIWLFVDKLKEIIADE